MLNTKAVGPDAILREAVFRLIEGETRPVAIEILKADGADCRQTVCSWNYVLRETAFDYASVRAPGPRRTTQQVYSVDLKSEIITSLADITSRVEIRKLH